MILEITTSHQPATDLGYLLHKHPDRLQTVDISGGVAHVFYPVADAQNCTACLVLDINPVELVRNKQANAAFLQEHYVNDRPYTSNSFLSTAIVKAFGSAINGTCHSHPHLVDTPLPLVAKIASLRIDADLDYIHKLFEPLGYAVSYDILPLDTQFADWGNSRYINLTISNTTTLKDLLSQIHVFILALDEARHYWVSQTDLESLLRRGGTWLNTHPQKEWITRRYLKNLRSFTNEALQRILGKRELEERAEISDQRQQTLHQRRLQLAFELIKASGAQRVLDVGCGEGKLMKLLLRDGQFKYIAGTDVSFRELEKAKDNLYLQDASPALRERVSLFQSSTTYKDSRFLGFDALALIEVIEHLDLERLSAMRKVIFGIASPTTVVVSTPNAEYNVVFERLAADAFRHDDHRFEWSRAEFADWCASVGNEFGYNVIIRPVGDELPDVGAPSQIAVFTKK